MECSKGKGKVFSSSSSTNDCFGYFTFFFVVDFFFRWGEI